MYGIRGTVVSLSINSYLSNRGQCVVCDEYKSDVLPVNVRDPLWALCSLIFLQITFPSLE